jgi:Heat induced stress protein YflT domain
MTSHVVRRQPAAWFKATTKDEPMAASDKTTPEPPVPPGPPRTIASVAPGRRRTIASYSNYADAESAVDWLADQGFAVERGAIVGTGLRSVEQLEGRMTAGRAAIVGAVAGIGLGVLLALLAGVFPGDPDSGEMLGYAVFLGAAVGAVSAALVHEALSGGRRDFISATRIEAARYDLQVDEDSAAEAERLLNSRPR